MWRLAALLLIAALAGCVLAWLLTGKSKYRRWAVRLGQFGLAVTLLFFASLILGRLLG